MADTRRTLAALQTLLADNSAGAISAQDIRDFLISACVPRGCIYISSASSSGVMSAGAWELVTGTTTSTLLVDFTSNNASRLYYSGAASPMEFMVDVSGDVTGTAADVLTFGIDDTAAGSPAAETQTELTLTGNKDQFHLSTRINLSATDYAEVWVKNTGTNAITVNHMQFRMWGIIS